MIYVCIPSHNDAETIGLVLWKIRKVFDEFPREYQLLVADDGSSDSTSEVLETYQRSLPLTVIRNEERKGDSASLQLLLEHAIRKTDRPKRDFAITLHGDFSISPSALPDLIKRFESGADVVIGEVEVSNFTFMEKLVTNSAPWLLRPGVRVPGVRDLISGCSGFRIVTLKKCFRDSGKSLLDSEGWSARAELVARAASVARQISTVSVRPGPNKMGNRPGNLALALELFRAGRSLDVRPPSTVISRAS